MFNREKKTLQRYDRICRYLKILLKGRITRLGSKGKIRANECGQADRKKKQKNFPMISTFQNRKYFPE